METDLLFKISSLRFTLAGDSKRSASVIFINPVLSQHLGSRFHHRKASLFFQVNSVGKLGKKSRYVNLQEAGWIP
jgi:hypothetical protein